jgi:TrmH family RNA methyltransferase
MISKNTKKFIISLQKKKIREQEGLFLIEGDKLVKEFLKTGRQVKTLIAKPEFISSLPVGLKELANDIYEVSYEELKSLSSLKTPHNALAVIPIPQLDPDVFSVLGDTVVALDCVQDPGNLGTIIRAAGWFGIKNLVCSTDCVDVYNPKVIQASMGAILHVNVYYTDLKQLFVRAKERRIPIFGTLLEGESIYTHNPGKKGIILLGNESKGISDELMPFVNEKIMIPKFSQAGQGIDSLNVGMAASIVFSEFLRKSGTLSD